MNTEITIDTTVSATIEKVWKYWTQAEHITKWNFANDEWHCPVAENDLKVGGKLYYRMEAKDGSAGFDFQATYFNVMEHQRISYLMSDGRNVSTLFQDKGEETKIVTIFDAEKENSIELQESGWQAILNNFKRYVENG